MMTSYLPPCAPPQGWREGGYSDCLVLAAPPHYPARRRGVREATLMISSSPPSAESMGYQSVYCPPPSYRSGGSE